MKQVGRRSLFSYLNLTLFNTVDAFAAEWGFIKTKSIQFNTISEVRKFTGECAESGEWEGEAVEGFVVRTRVADAPDAVHTGEPGQAVVAPPIDGSQVKLGNGLAKKNRDRSAPPYPPGSSFFFKVKFDEPYMMYRDWREVTKSLLTLASKTKITTPEGKKYANQSLSATSLPKNKMKRPETRVYVDWIIKEMKKDLVQFDDYTKNKGIIATRERFLEWLKTHGDELKKVQEEDGTSASAETVDAGKAKEQGEERFKKTIIVPVAIPGCGKTAVSIALTHIMNTPAYQELLKAKVPGGKQLKWGHTQSDDVHVKKAGPAFVKNVMNLLGDGNCDVVIADKCVSFILPSFHKVLICLDRNNHLFQHRAALREAVDKLGSPSKTAGGKSKKGNGKGKQSDVGEAPDDAAIPVRLLALDWGVSGHPPAMIHRICADRVLNRGQNHQTLRTGTKSLEAKTLEEQEHAQDEADKAYEEVLWQFIVSAEALTPSEVDVVVDMEVEETMEQAVRRALRGCLKIIYGVKESELATVMPTDDVIQKGVGAAKTYKPALIKPDEKKTKEEEKARYFGMLPEVDLVQVIDARLAAEISTNTLSDGITTFWTHLKSSNRVAKRPHITIVHRNTLSEPSAHLDHELWQRCIDLQKLGKPPMFRGKLGSLICDARVLALTFEDFSLDPETLASDGQEGPEFVSKLPHHVRDRLHITVGTKEQSIPGVEAKSMVEKFRRYESDGLSVLDMKGAEDLWVKGRIKPLNN